MANELEIPAGVKTTNNVPADSWYGPYASLAAARAAVPTSMRLYRTVGIIEAEGIIDYVWQNGTTDGDLVIKTASTDPATETDYGTVVLADQSEAEAAANEPVVTDVPNTITPSLRSLRYFLDRCLATARAITGNWTAPTQAMGTNDTKLANCAFVNQQIDEAIVDRGTVASGTLVIDCSRKNHKVILTGTVTLDYTNLVAGREYKLWVERSTNTTVTLLVNKWAAPLKMTPAFTNPTANGSSPAKAIDLLSWVVRDASERPAIVITPDIQNL
jgi:hypothetical protein